jgi:hypothetical protein
MFQIFEKRNLYFDLEDYQGTYNNPYAPSDIYLNTYHPLTDIQQIKQLFENSCFVYYIEPESNIIRRAKCKFVYVNQTESYFETPLFENRYLILFFTYLQSFGEVTQINSTEKIANSMYLNGTPLQLSKDIFNKPQEVRRHYFESDYVYTNVLFTDVYGS